MVGNTVSFAENGRARKGTVTDIQHQDNGQVEYEILAEDGNILYVPADACNNFKQANNQYSLPVYTPPIHNGAKHAVLRKLREARSLAEGNPQLQQGIDNLLRQG